MERQRTPALPPAPGVRQPAGRAAGGHRGSLLAAGALWLIPLAATLIECLCVGSAAQRASGPESGKPGCSASPPPSAELSRRGSGWR